LKILGLPLNHASDYAVIVFYFGLLFTVPLDQSQTSQHEMSIKRTLPNGMIIDMRIPCAPKKQLLTHEKVYGPGFDRFILRELFRRALLPVLRQAISGKTVDLQNKEAKINPDQPDVRLSLTTT
jgi:hypothetical protein